MDKYSQMDENMKKIKQAGIRLVGEELPRMKATPKKQKKTSYPSNRRWFRVRR